jgi:hypothetical protein
VIIPLFTAAALVATPFHAAAGESRGDPIPGSEPEPQWSVPIAHGAGLLMGMRVSLSVLWPKSYDLWPTEQARRNIERAYTEPPFYDPHRPLLESDGSPLFLNVVGHGTFGSEVYQRARACRLGLLGSFALTALTSSVWEYVLEAPHQHPSAVDLIWTPFAGAAFGELRFHLWRLARGDPLGTPPLTRRAMMILLDPFGEAERALGTGC